MGMSKPTRHYSKMSDDDSRMEELYGKVNTLKEVTIQIGDRARQDNRDLDGIQTGFSGLDGLLKGTISKIKLLSQTDGNYTLYTILFALFIFFVLYLIFR